MPEIDSQERRKQRVALVGAGPSSAIDTYGRTASVSRQRPEGFVSGEHSAALRWSSVRQDLATGVERLRANNSQASVVMLGFCLGGRISLLAATCSELDLAGSVAFYAQTRGAARSDLPAPDMLVDRLTCPMLSIFGGADEFIDSDEIEAWQGTLTNASVAHEVVVYRKLPHSFFDRRAGEFETQSDDAARRVVDFVSSVAA